VQLTLSGNICKSIRIGLTNVNPTPMRALGAEQRLTGQALTDEALEAAGQSAAAECSPSADLRGSEEYKRDLTRAQVTDLTHFLKDQVESTAKDRNPTQPPNVLTGNLEAGRAYFNGAGKCNTCHSPTGDLKGVGGRFKDAIDLQQRFLFPRRTKPVQVTVTPAGGQAVTGDLSRIDDFNVQLKDAAGQSHSWTRTPTLRIDLKDPLTAHNELLDVYTDQDMHNVVRYLESLK